MFGRDKTSKSAPAPTEAHPVREGAKNRPTPKRRDQEAARRQPLVQTDRKLARTQDRTKRRQEAELRRAGILAGDDKWLYPRDKGPQRRFLRDWVDARRNLGEFMLPAMLVVLALSFVRQYWALTLTAVLVYGLVLVAVVDAWLMWRGAKKAATAKFGQLQRGSVMYAVMRAFQMRRTRTPPPMVARGEFPK